MRSLTTRIGLLAAEWDACAALPREVRLPLGATRNDGKGIVPVAHPATGDANSVAATLSTRRPTRDRRRALLRDTRESKVSVGCATPPPMCVFWRRGRRETVRNSSFFGGCRAATRNDERRLWRTAKGRVFARRVSARACGEKSLQEVAMGVGMGWAWGRTRFHASGQL